MEKYIEINHLDSNLKKKIIDSLLENDNYIPLINFQKIL